MPSISGLPVLRGSPRACGSKCAARMLGEASSDPVTTAVSQNPPATFRNPYLNALTPAQQTPLVAYSLARRAVERRMHHAGMAGNELVRARGAAGEAGDVGG